MNFSLLRPTYEIQETQSILSHPRGPIRANEKQGNRSARGSSTHEGEQTDESNERVRSVGRSAVTSTTVVEDEDRVVWVSSKGVDLIEGKGGSGSDQQKARRALPPSCRLVYMA